MTLLFITKVRNLPSFIMCTTPRTILARALLAQQEIFGWQKIENKDVAAVSFKRILNTVNYWTKLKKLGAYSCNSCSVSGLIDLK